MIAHPTDFLWQDLGRKSTDLQRRTDMLNVMVQTFTINDALIAAATFPSIFAIGAISCAPENELCGTAKTVCVAFMVMSFLFSFWTLMTASTLMMVNNVWGDDMRGDGRMWQNFIGLNQRLEVLYLTTLVMVMGSVTSGCFVIFEARAQMVAVAAVAVGVFFAATATNSWNWACFKSSLVEDGNEGVAPADGAGCDQGCCVPEKGLAAKEPVRPMAVAHITCMELSGFDHP